MDSAEFPEFRGVAPSPPAPVRHPTGTTTLEVLRALGSTPRGLTEADALERLARVEGAAPPPRRSRALLVGRALAEPFTGLMCGVVVVSALVGLTMIVAVAGTLLAASAALRVLEELRRQRANTAVDALGSSTATVRRRAMADADPVTREVPPDQLVPGDVVLLAAGDRVPADVRLLHAQGLHVAQSALTGEGEPVVKSAPAVAAHDLDAGTFDRAHLCFLGSTVASGTATAVVVATGAATRFGEVQDGAGPPAGPYRTAVRRIARTLSCLVLGTVVVATLTVAACGRESEAWPLAVSVALGVIPEMLPLVVATVLARGSRAALGAAGGGVAADSPAAVADLGAVGVLCLDKTGTLTDDATVVDQGLDPDGRPDDAVVRWAALAAREMLLVGPPGGVDATDEALLALRPPECTWDHIDRLEGVDARAFDPVARTSTVVVADPRRPHRRTVIMRGAPESVAARCTLVRRAGGDELLDDRARDGVDRLVASLCAGGLRLVAVAVTAQTTGLPDGEPTLLGFVGLRDRARDDAPAAVAELAASGVRVVVLTGDHPGAAERVCREVGIDPGAVVLGDGTRALDDRALAELAARSAVFARVAPEDKARLVRALRADGHTVGFLGDGLNDAPALRAADVGVCTGKAVGAARAAADAELRGPGLGDLPHAVRAGRVTTARIGAYLRIVLSSNLGNALSMVAAAVFVPFLPMLPGEVLFQNLCFDAAQLTLAFDRVTPAAGPRVLDPRAITRFALRFAVVNACSDLLTFALLHVLTAHGAAGEAGFRAGWFTENLVTQAVALVMLRGPGVRKGLGPVGLAALALAAVGVFVPLSPAAGLLSLGALPALGYPAVGAVVAGYALVLRMMRNR